MKIYYIAFGVLSAVVIGLIVYAFTVVGTPGQRRALEFDQDRMSDFRSIGYAVDAYYRTNSKLPSTLDAAKTDSYYSTPDTYTDPKSGEAYGYKTLGKTQYELCADFGTDTTDPKTKKASEYSYYDEKDHKKGYNCIQYEVEDYGSGFNTPDYNDVNDGFAVPSTSSDSGSSVASRDARRIADVRQIMTALELYYNDNNAYPDQVAAGSSPTAASTGPFGSASTEWQDYLALWPIAPTPNDGSCAAGVALAVTQPTNQYTYWGRNITDSASALSDPASYRLTFCLGAATGGYAAGVHFASPYGIQ